MASPFALPRAERSRVRRVPDATSVAITLNIVSATSNSTRVNPWLFDFTELFPQRGNWRSLVRNISVCLNHSLLHAVAPHPPQCEIDLDHGRGVWLRAVLNWPDKRKGLQTPVRAVLEIA